MKGLSNDSPFCFVKYLSGKGDRGGDVADGGIAVEFGGFGVTTAQKSGADDASTVVPEAELGDGLREAAGVDITEQGGVAEVGDADVEGEVDERVELGLCEPDGDGLIDAVGGSANVAEEVGDSLFLGDGLAGVYAGGMSIADGPDAVRILIGGEDVALKEFGESETVLL